MPPRIYLIRHGETEWSNSGRYTGRTDLPLTAHGEASAGELGRCLRDLLFTDVLSSPRRRARRTCELMLPGVRMEIEPDLAEWDYGEHEGLHSAAVHEQSPGWNLFRDGCPGGETPAQVSTRADRLIANVRRLKGNIALFSHGHFGRVLGVRWIELPITEAQHFLLGIAAVSVLDYEHGRADSPVIAHWNASSIDITAGHTAEMKLEPVHL